jgi:hypothetical protein
MEGVVSVLDKCRHLVVHLLAQSAWSLMVRLLTGIGRYVEMNYIYQLLKENQQFEFLLRKGYDKVKFNPPRTKLHFFFIIIFRRFDQENCNYLVRS